MRVAVCDFPSAYGFPPASYGGIERWLYAVACGVEANGWELTLVGPRWSPGATAGRRHLQTPLRELPIRPGDAPAFDVVVPGHEDVADDGWRAHALALAGRVATFQHSLNDYGAPVLLDRDRVSLFCYSPEMLERYTELRPRPAFAPGADLTPEPGARPEGDFDLWMGRIYPAKAPHIAAQAALRARRRLVLAGPIHDHAYWRRYASCWDNDYVTYAGEVGGAARANLLVGAARAVYTRARDYVEPGALVFSDYARAGLPVVATTYNGRDCAAALLTAWPALGRLVVLDAGLPERDIVATLADVLTEPASVAKPEVQDLGRAVFSLAAHAATLVG